MKYCRVCGNQIMDEAVMCPKCGSMQNSEITATRQKEKNGGTYVKVVITIISLTLLGIVFLVWGLPAIRVMNVKEAKPFSNPEQTYGELLYEYFDDGVKWEYAGNISTIGANLYYVKAKGYVSGTLVELTFMVNKSTNLISIANISIDGVSTGYNLLDFLQ